jgi:hypothetical protein
VLRIRPDAYQASFEALATDIDRALTQLARWRPTVTEVATEATASETAERSTGLEG